MKRRLKKIWQRLICTHTYKFKEYVMLHGGMRKMVTHQCVKCGKEKVYIV
jgi:hypothetical protein